MKKKLKKAKKAKKKAKKKSKNKEKKKKMEQEESDENDLGDSESVDDEHGEPDVSAIIEFHKLIDSSGGDEDLAERAQMFKNLQESEQMEKVHLKETSVVN